MNKKHSCHWVYLLLLVPFSFFIISLFIPAAISSDTGQGFLALRGMLLGGAFNVIPSPDPKNIANDVGTFITWWSPGQYLAPGLFVWLGATYGLAVSLTALIAGIIGVLGWIRIARGFDVSTFVLFLFVTGLVTFHYATDPFRAYIGGEVILFAILPWFLSALRWGIQARPPAAFTVSVVSAALLFFAKLSGLVAFVVTVGALSLLEISTQRRITSSLLAIWGGAAVAALFLYFFWLGHGATPISGAHYAFTWPAISFPIEGAVFSAVTTQGLAEWLFMRPPAPILSSSTTVSYVLAPLGGVLMGWVWFVLRNTPYRAMVIFMFLIIALYIAAFFIIYVRDAGTVAFVERYFRYPGLLSFLLLLVAADQCRRRLAKAITIVIIGMFSVYGLASYANTARKSVRNRQYDQASGTSMQFISPVVLQYLRSEMATHNWRHAVVAMGGPQGALGLPNYRILSSFSFTDEASLEGIARQKWAGRTDRIFVVLDEKMLADAKAEAVLKTFVDYNYDAWSQKAIDGAIVYFQ